MRDRRRGLEALRRDLELGRLRRGFLGVVGRGGSNQSQNSAEELPAYSALDKWLVSNDKVSSGARASFNFDTPSRV